MNLGRVGQGVTIAIRDLRDDGVGIGCWVSLDGPKGRIEVSGTLNNSDELHLDGVPAEVIKALVEREPTAMEDVVRRYFQWYERLPRPDSKTVTHQSW